MICPRWAGRQSLSSDHRRAHLLARARQSKLAARNVTINNLLPGVFDTDRIRTTTRAQAQKSGKTEDEIIAARLNSVPARRLGGSDEFGAMCAFLCSVHASYITGQNVLMDGGAFPGTM